MSDATITVISNGADAGEARLGALRPWRAGRADFLGSSAGLAAGTIGAAAFGFAFWVLAARTLPADAVGHAAAVISLVALLGALAECGLGPLLMAEVAAGGSRSMARAAAGLATVMLTSGFLGGVCLVAAHASGTDLNGVARRLDIAAIALGTCILGSLTIVVDHVLLGLGKARLQMGRNLLSGAIRLACLVAATRMGGRETSADTIILLAWLAGAAAPLVLVAACMRVTPSLRVPELGLLKPLLRRAAGHHALNIAVQAPALILPAVVSTMLSPATGAAFYAALMIMNGALIIPASLVTMVQGAATRDPARLASLLRVSLIVSLAPAATATLAFFFPILVLGFFNPRYSLEIGAALPLFGLLVAATICKFHFLAVARLRARLAPAAGLLMIGALAEVGAACVGASCGIAGLLAGWAAALIVEASAMAPTIARAARDGSRD